MDLDKEMLKGYINAILISLLKTKEMYGYEIAKKIRKTSNGEFEINEATLYIALKRLEKSGLIESYWDDEQSGGGRRKYYRLTSNGESYLEGKIQEWYYFKNIVDKFLVRDI